MKASAFLFIGAVALLQTGEAIAKVQAGNKTVLALDRVLSPAIQPLYVSSPAAENDQPMPDAYTAFGKDLSPPVEWDGAPPGVQSYVLIMEDPETRGQAPTLHWLAYDIPATATGLRRNVRGRGEPKTPLGMKQGLNFAGGIGYIGPHPPAGDPPHHYHIEVFALSRVLGLKPDLPLEKVIAAMNDHVMAEGEVVATFAAPAPQAEPAASPK